jgi:transcriptional regulator with XRE-family HTH domain
MNTSLRLALAKNIASLMQKTPALDTQVKLAKRSGIAQSSVGRILRGEVAATLDNIESIATAFGVSADFLLQYETSEQPDLVIFGKDLTKLAEGLDPADLSDVLLFIEFKHAKREAEQVGGLAHVGQVLPDREQRAKIARSVARPMGEATLSMDESKTPEQLQHAKKRDRHESTK